MTAESAQRQRVRGGRLLNWYCDLQRYELDSFFCIHKNYIYSAVVQVDPDAFSHLSMPDQSSQPSQPTFNPNSGFSIPQHIVIPPETNADPTQPRKYQINSEITIAYDPNQGTLPRPSSRYPGEGQVSRL